MQRNSNTHSSFLQGPVFFCWRLPRASRSAFCSTASSEASPPPEALLDCGQCCQVSARGVLKLRAGED